MRIIILTLLLTVSAFAQNQFADAQTACGPKDISFAVKQANSQHTVAQPDPGQALIYFIQEKGVDHFPLVTRMGLDGAWVGANKNSSYFTVPVKPGEHHVCASVNSHLGHPIGLAHFTAEAGKVYYFNARVTYTESAAYLFFGPIDSDQGKYLVATSPLSVSTPGK